MQIIMFAVDASKCFLLWKVEGLKIGHRNCIWRLFVIKFHLIRTEKNQAILGKSRIFFLNFIFDNFDFESFI